MSVSSRNCNYLEDPLTEGCLPEDGTTGSHDTHSAPQGSPLAWEPITAMSLRSA